MINTKCQECMFSKPNDCSDGKTCSKNIIEQITNIKNIVQDNNKFNIIENYACRYGFSKQVYEQHKDKWDPKDFEFRLSENSKIRLYLLLDCYNDNKYSFDSILQSIPQLSIVPKAVSFMFRNIEYRPFNNTSHNDFLASNYSNIQWKIHNFVEHTELEYGIDHILATNARNNDTVIFLVYNSEDLGSLNNDLQTINQHMILYQSPMIAMIDNNKSLYRLAMSFENYKVAKSLGENLIPVLTQESNIIYY